MIISDAIPEEKELMALARFTDALADWTGRVIWVFILPMVFVLIYEVTARYAAGSPTIWAHEVSSYLFGAYFMLGGAYALRWGAHVKVDIFYRRLGVRPKAVVDLIIWPLFYVFCGVLLWHSAEGALASVQTMEHSGTLFGPPIWPVKLCVPLGILIMLIQGVGKTIRDVFAAINGRRVITPVRNEP